MLASVKWINDYLDRPASAEEQADLLTRAGFPIAGREDVDGDVRLDVETTSNRGDCVSHVGLAREIVAMSGGKLKPPTAASKATGPAAASAVKVTNREKELCPLYTARIIKGIKVGPSPPWLAERLRAVGQIPRNNVVDATNFVLLELGQPTHVFDMAKLAGPEIIIRRAAANEPFLPIGEGAAPIKLSDRDLVIADAKSPVALAGVKGGALSAVSNSTRDILIESATFDPVTVRHTSRRHAIASDSSYRFERGVHPAQVDPAAERLAALILELCGGTLCTGAVSDGAPIPQARRVGMRTQRCRQIIGIDLPDERMMKSLQSLSFEPKLRDGSIECVIPPQRLDIEREVDLIEEVARLLGTENIPIAETIHVRVAPPQGSEQARQAVFDALVGMGFIETCTHSLISEQAASAFCPPDVELLRVSDVRAKAEPVLRPSILPSLLRVLAYNRDNGVKDVSLFEQAATFGRWRGSHIENVNLAFVHPPRSQPIDLRFTRGVIERLAKLVAGPETTIEVAPLDAFAWLSPGASVKIGERMLGTLGVIPAAILKTFGIDEPLLAAEIGLPALYDRYPPITQSQALPAFPAIERDISAIVEESVPWTRVSAVVAELKPPHLEAVEFVTAYRGKQIGAGRKSVTMRLRFRAADRTLTHEEVDAPVTRVIAKLSEQLRAEIRT